MAKPYLFVSYSHSDSLAIDDMALLKARGLSIWYDERLNAGANWRDQLATTIEQSSGLIFFASAGSLASQYCKEEIDYALRQDLPVLTVYSEAVELSPGLNMALGSRQAILRQGLDRDDYLNQLVFAAEGMVRPFDRRKARSDRHSIAIMRFENLSNDPDNAYLADGIAEELLTGLSQISGVRVASKSSSFAIKTATVDVRQVGQQLNVAWILEGSVRKAGQRIRVSARLSECHSGVLVWAENFDRELVDLFDLQDDIAASVLAEVSNRLNVQLDKPQIDFGTSSIEAYNSYLQGRHESLKFTGSACDLAVSHLRHAIDVDPNFLRARWSLITSLEALRVILGRDGLLEEIALQKTELRKLDPEGQLVNWEAADQVAESNIGGTLDTIEKMLTGVLRFPEEKTPTGVSADRWWAGGYSVDDGVSGKVDAYAQYGLLLAGAGLYHTARAFIDAAEHESTALVNIQAILGDFGAARLTVERYLSENPHIAIHYFTYVMLLHQLGETDEAQRQYEKVLGIVDGDLAKVAGAYHAYWGGDEGAYASFVKNMENAVTPHMFRGICLAGKSPDLAAEQFIASIEAKEPFAPAIRVWAPGNIRSEDWQEISSRKDLQEALDAAGIGHSWQTEMANRARALQPITNISILDSIAFN